MKYTTEIDINKPIEQVIALFDNPENMKQWMEGLQTIEHIGGVQGQPGAKLKLTYQTGKRTFSMIETIIARNLPEDFTGIYEANGMSFTVKNKFIKLSDNKTKHIAENDFQLKGLMKVMGFLMPGAFKKNSMKYLIAFKDFAEKQ